MAVVELKQSEEILPINRHFFWGGEEPVVVVVVTQQPERNNRKANGWKEKEDNTLPEQMSVPFA
jgi:hypothetical protein